MDLTPFGNELFFFINTTQKVSPPPKKKKKKNDNFKTRNIDKIWFGTLIATLIS